MTCKPKRFRRRRRGKKVQFKCNCKPVSNLWLSVNCGKITLYLPLRDVFLHKAQIGNLKVGMEAPEMLFAVWSQSTNTLNLMFFEDMRGTYKWTFVAPVVF